MAASPAASSRIPADGRTTAERRPVRRSIVASAMVLIAALILDGSDAGGFGAKQAWLYFTIARSCKGRAASVIARSSRRYRSA
jgi:hypothetical protein